MWVMFWIVLVVLGIVLRFLWLVLILVRLGSVVGRVGIVCCILC